MRFLILNSDYPEFLRWFYARHPGLDKQPYHAQMEERRKSLFGVADFYSHNLGRLGHEAWDIYMNNECMQRAWAREHGILVKAPPETGRAARVVQRAKRFILARLRKRMAPFQSQGLFPVNDAQTFLHDILEEQIRFYRPDILLNQDMFWSPSFFRTLKPHVGLLVGQHAASPLPDSQDWGCYDLVISSFPPIVQWFKDRGIPAEFHLLGFDERIRGYLHDAEKGIPVSFVGSMGRIHSSRLRLLEQVCRECDIKIWAPGIDLLPGDSPVRRCYQGQAFGVDMYRVIARSMITLNHHGDIAPYANNLRLFEATGVGTFLLTDWKENLPELLEPGREVVAYQSPEECAGLIRHYLAHEKERDAIARAGQQRTLREHSYLKRMEELTEVVAKHGGQRGKG